ncbi:MAG TPA: bifunctional oligoribonuclease/PAP phosphatase NrnA [Bacillota bacterium]|nr:bifunctional oligoribonuclease/PAP phosphatase NrnA [Bacillota bacterium]
MPLHEILSTIKQYETIIIHHHIRPDPDALGSSAALKEILLASFPEKNVYLAGEEDPALRFLTPLDDITDEMYDGALVIVCDTANTDRINDQRYHLGDKIIKIDHHPNVDPYGDIEWIDTSVSSTSEMIYTFYLTLKEEGLKMNDDAARLIYAGIVGDTGRFLFPSTSNTTFKYAAELVTYDFNRESLYDGIYQIDENVARLRGYILQNFTMSDRGVSIVKIPKKKLEKFQITPLQSGELVSVLGDIKGIRVWAFFIEEDENLIRVRLRSKGPVINEIAAKYNGGGHPLASGAQVETWEEADELARELEELCK